MHNTCRFAERMMQALAAKMCVLCMQLHTQILAYVWKYIRIYAFAYTKLNKGRQLHTHFSSGSAAAAHNTINAVYTHVQCYTQTDTHHKVSCIYGIYGCQSNWPWPPTAPSFLWTFICPNYPMRESHTLPHREQQHAPSVAATVSRSLRFCLFCTKWEILSSSNLAVPLDMTPRYEALSANRSSQQTGSMWHFFKVFLSLSL